MTVFEYVIILFSILFSVAFAHMLQSVAQLIRAAKRVRFSALHAIWMLNVFVIVLTNWLGLWELRDLPRWPTAYVVLLTIAISIQYVAVVLICPAVPPEGEVDLRTFHQTQGPRYLAGFASMELVSVPLNVVTAEIFGVATWRFDNFIQAPMAILIAAAIFLRSPRAQWPLSLAVLALSAFALATFVSAIG